MNSIPLTESDTNVLTESNHCRFCKDYNGELVYIPDWSKRPIAHLVVTIAEDGSNHVHGPIEDEKMMTRLIDIAMMTMHKKAKETKTENVA